MGIRPLQDSHHCCLSALDSQLAVHPPSRDLTDPHSSAGMGVWNLLLQTRKLEAQARNGACSESGSHVGVTSQSLRFFICKDGGAVGFPGLL